MIELDKDLYGPDNHLVEVSSNMAAVALMQRKRLILGQHTHTV